MGPGQTFLTWVGSGQPPLGLENFPKKYKSIFPLCKKTLIGLGQKTPSSKMVLPLILQVKSMLVSGQAWLGQDSSLGWMEELLNTFGPYPNPSLWKTTIKWLILVKK